MKLAHAPTIDPAALPLAGVIDIGSNSIRLVVYRGRTRAPEMLFNEKVMAGLGAGLPIDGRLAADAIDIALASLRRFARVASEMGVTTLRSVATAAVREATNGAEFAQRVRAETGLAIEVIDGETEARGSAYGVIAGIPGADGVVGDLGGGSLELIRIHGGEPHARISLPIGSLKLAAARAEGRTRLNRYIERALEAVDWLEQGAGRPLYAVGGSWRALAHLHMHLTGFPLPIIHQYAMDADAPDRLVRTLARMNPRTLRAVPGISAQRAHALPGAAALLSAVVDRLGASTIIASAYGLREGLLYMSLPDAIRAEDPLIGAARSEAARMSRFPEAGAALVGWTAPLFAADPPPLQRLRAAAAILSDVGWAANPDFRADRALDIALHGPWVGIDAEGRALLAAALNACFGGDAPDPLSDTPLPWSTLAEPHLIARATAWGLALRLGQRLAGGAPAVFARARLEASPGRVTLTLPGELKPLGGPAIARRLKALATALGLEPVIA